MSATVAVPEMLTTAAGVARLAGRLAEEPLVACDLEADSMHHYQEKVCLIQFAFPGGAALLDPLAVTDLASLVPVFAAESIRKIFHGADYDIRSLHRDFAIEVNNLFDTMIACQFLGERDFGLAAVLKKRFGAELDKQYQRADWSRRPLTAGMIDYAMKDTSLLIALYQQLEGELRAKNRLAWVEEECALLARVRMVSRSDEPLFLRFKGAARLESRALAVLEELLRFRDQRARQADVPQFKVLGTDTMRELAEKRPQNRSELIGISGITDKVLDRIGEGILRAIERGNAVPAGKLPVYPRQERRKRGRLEDERLKALKEWRERTAAVLGIDTGVLANNALLERLAYEVPRTVADLGQIPAMRNWQRQEFGAALVALINSCR